MSKKKAHLQKSAQRPPAGKRQRQMRRKTILIVSLILSFSLAGIILARWRITSPVPTYLLPAPQPRPSLSLSSPSKEYIYAGGRLVAIEEPPGTPSSNRINVALASNGGVATASSTTPISEGNFPVSAINNGDRKGINWANGGGWRDATDGTYPDWMQIEFSGNKSIDEIDVVTIQDAPDNPVEPTETQTFSLYGITAFNAQYWDGSGWQTVSNGSVTGNNKVWNKFTFTTVTTSKIRVFINHALYGRSRLIEVEAWGTSAASRTNVALASNGATVSASSTGSVGGTFPASGANNGDRKGLNWESGGGWRDGTDNSFPDWLQVDFKGVKTIDEVDVFTIQDAYASPAEPTEAMTFNLYGVTAFDVQYWNGASWATVPGASVTGNDKVWRKFTFSPVTTTKVRVVVNNALYSASRIIEVEAWGTN